MEETGLHRKVWREFNRLLEYIDEITPRKGFGIRTSRTPNGTTIAADIPKQEQVTTGGTGRRFMVKQVFDDHLGCVEYDGSEGASTLIAKPHELRKTGWHGVTINYPLVTGGTLSILYTYLSASHRTARITAGATSVTETQYINPYYVPNQTIISAIQLDNGTGVSAADEWVEVSMRAWARLI